MKMMNNNLVQILKQSKNIVFFGGAGVSTESGIPDFRSEEGIYNQKTNNSYSPEEIVSHYFFKRRPKDFYSFYKAKLVHLEAKPNDCHRALVTLEKMGKLSAIITQNIDGLHQAAGSKNVIELHGSVYENYCIKCHKKYDISYILNAKDIPFCSCGKLIRPDIVLYGETLDENVIKQAIEAISSADTLIIGGTSLIVYPAATLVNYFHGKTIVLINKTVTPADEKANLIIHDPIAKVMNSAVTLLLKSTEI
ncbi:NAD-dependent deacetylase [Propionispira arboris]|uniref:NAD-dependent protein deacetylase n=1 Tax=Propionispira arboris TaxID=84035 RepID=A0A1H7D2N1_9FIRM|nr:NAD-dependent deacetylase [Propionispira arboris]